MACGMLLPIDIIKLPNDVVYRLTAACMLTYSWKLRRGPPPSELCLYKTLDILNIRASVDVHVCVPIDFYRSGTFSIEIASHDSETALRQLETCFAGG